MLSQKYFQKWILALSRSYEPKIASSRVSRLLHNGSVNLNLEMIFFSYSLLAFSTCSIFLKAGFTVEILLRFTIASTNCCTKSKHWSRNATSILQYLMQDVCLLATSLLNNIFQHWRKNISLKNVSNEGGSYYFSCGGWGGISSMWSFCQPKHSVSSQEKNIFTKNTRTSSKTKYFVTFPFSSSK